MMPAKCPARKYRDKKNRRRADFRGAGVSLVLTQEGPAVFCAAKKTKSPAGRRRHKTNSRYRIEVVAVTGKHRKARALNAHFNGVIGLRTIGLSGRVGKCVLIAGLLGNARIKPFQIIAARRVENISTRRVRIFRENAVSKESDAAI